jgi:hypothetical protein
MPFMALRNSGKSRRCAAGAVGDLLGGQHRRDDIGDLDIAGQNLVVSPSRQIDAGRNRRQKAERVDLRAGERIIVHDRKRQRRSQHGTEHLIEQTAVDREQA